MITYEYGRLVKNSVYKGTKKNLRSLQLHFKLSLHFSESHHN